MANSENYSRKKVTDATELLEGITDPSQQVAILLNNLHHAAVRAFLAGNSERLGINVDGTFTKQMLTMLASGELDDDTENDIHQT